VRLAAKVEPLFVESTDALPSAILAIAQDHDVIIVMGAGSIGQVAAKTRTLAMEGV
jgi:UDP-N-acetylmuramate--alanine ligase